MAAWAWLSRGLRTPQVLPVHALEPGREAWLEGVIDPLELLTDPISGQPAVAVDYRAEVPSALGQIYPGLMGSSASTVHHLIQATDFLLRTPDGSVRVLPDPETTEGDTAALHRRLLELHGVELRARAHLLRPLQAVRLQVDVLDVSEHHTERSVPWRATAQLRKLVTI